MNVLKQISLRKRKFLFYSVIFVLLVFVSFYYFEIFKPKQISVSGSPSNIIVEVSDMLNIKSDPFEDITIPKLRERTYESKLTELKKVSENSSYTTYLTSYQSDGLKVNGLLTQPKGEKPKNGWPAVVFIHGYIPPSQYRTQQNYVDYVNYLARNGIVVFKIDLRGHDQSEGDAGGGYYSADYVIDTLNAYSALQSTEFVDAKSVGLWGHSMAGNIVLRAVAAKKDIPAVVIWAGAGFTYQDLSDYGITDNSYRPPDPNSPARRRRAELFATHGPFDINSKFWYTMVPTNYLQDVVTAIQLDHAVDDTVVSIEYSRNLDKILNTTTLQHRLNEYPSGGHNINGSNFNGAMQNTVNFYKQYL